MVIDCGSYSDQFQLTNFVVSIAVATDTSLPKLDTGNLVGNETEEPLVEVLAVEV